jgi:hypothetical protein
LGANETRVELVGGDGMDAVAERFEGGESGERLCLRKSGRENCYGGCGCRVEKVATSEWGHGIRG